MPEDKNDLNQPEAFPRTDRPTLAELQDRGIDVHEGPVGFKTKDPFAPSVGGRGKSKDFEF